MPPTPTPDFGTTTCDLNLRQGAGTSFPILTTLKPNTPLTVLQEAGAWLKVRVGGQEGFVSRKFVRMLEHQLPEGFLIHRPEVQEWPLVPAAPLKAPAKADASVRSATAIWNRFGGLLEPLAETIAINPAAAVAVVAAESGGSGFKDGRMIIRFENHYFWNLWGKHNSGAFNSRFTFNKSKPWTGHWFRPGVDKSWQRFHNNQADEWMVFDAALSLNTDAAHSAISMGLPQIMGANHGLIGYETAGEMFAAFNRDERTQLIGLFDFIKGPHSLSPSVNALQNRDFTSFAARYNGSGQAAAYSSTLQRYYEAFAMLRG